MKGFVFEGPPRCCTADSHTPAPLPLPLPRKVSRKDTLRNPTVCITGIPHTQTEILIPLSYLRIAFTLSAQGLSSHSVRKHEKAKYG